MSETGEGAPEAEKNNQDYYRLEKMLMSKSEGTKENPGEKVVFDQELAKERVGKWLKGYTEKAGDKGIPLEDALDKGRDRLNSGIDSALESEQYQKDLKNQEKYGQGVEASQRIQGVVWLKTELGENYSQENLKNWIDKAEQSERAKINNDAYLKLLDFAPLTEMPDGHWEYTNETKDKVEAEFKNIKSDPDAYSDFADTVRKARGSDYFTEDKANSPALNEWMSDMVKKSRGYAKEG